MGSRESVFADLKTKFYDWLSVMGVDPNGAGKHYRDNLEAIGEPIQPHSTPTGKWFGLYEQLTGEKPKPIYSVVGVADFARNYGKAISFFTVSKSFEDARERIRALYPRANNFDALYDFAYTAGDNGHTRNGFTRYIQFLYELESQIDYNQTIAMKDNAMQKIFYGAPGTGKSHGVDEAAKTMPKEDVVRTTFHPDSDYSTFVGAYKPVMDCVPRVAMDESTVKKATYDAEITADEREKLEVEKRISYEFVPQAFAKAYVQAWKRMAVPGADEKVAPVMLVIEEINRGDCAKVFGDLFQLLDRRVKDDELDPAKKAGFSEYPVLADGDLAEFIRGELFGVKSAIEGMGYGSVVAADKLELMLPPNLYIWATMNTSDQSLFPIDSAFKRRWDWQYVPISKPDEEGWVDRKIVVGTTTYDWWSFLTIINKWIEKATESEDKQLGYFFVKAPDDTGVITAERFVNKVLFYLFGDVFKSYDLPKEIFGKGTGSDKYAFRDFFYDKKETIATGDSAVVKKAGDVREDVLKEFLDKLHWGPDKIGKEETASAGA